MKKIRTFQLAVTLMVLLVPTALSAVNTIIHTVNYGSSGLTVGSDTLGGVTYTTVNYGDMFNGGEPGKPSLPIDYLKFSVPYNATNFSVSATLSNNVTQYINHLVYPCQQPRMMSDTTPVVINLPDSSVYYTNSFYPSQAAWVVDEGFLAGENHIVTVAVMPIAYKHKTGTLTSNDQLRRSGTVRLTLRYDLSDSLAMYPIVRNDTALRNEGYRLTQSIVVNPTNVEAYAPTNMVMDTMMVVNPNSGDGLNVLPPEPNDPIDPNPGVLEEASYPYLIVTTPELKHSLRRLAALKRQKGYSTLIVTMDDVMNDPLARDGDRIRQADGSYHVYSDSAGVLRQFLKLYYRNHGTEYVFLAGSIPYRYISSRANQNIDSLYNIPTDIYYADLNGDTSIANIDFFPELYVGRLIAKTPEQIANYTDKLLRYEMDPGSGDASYLSRAFASFGYDMKRGGEVGAINNEMNQLFSRYDNFVEKTDGTIFPTGNDIIDSINENKYGFISLNHHGCPSGLITFGYRSGYDNTNSIMRFLWAIDTVKIMSHVKDHVNLDPSIGNGLNNLTNRLHPNICYSTSCTTMPYDTVTNYSSIPMSFGESFTTGKNYGGPAFIGNTRDGVTPATGTLEGLFLKHLINGHHKLGIANGLAKAENGIDNADSIARKYMPITQNLLGDPEFEIWTSSPYHYTGTQVIRSDNQISVSVGNTDSTIVACYGNDGVVKKSMASTSVTFSSISPNCTVMLYKHNYIPYIAPLFLQNASFNQSQYVIASDVTAGRAIDSGRTQGDVTVNSGIEYEIEASGTVTLQDGFNVEKGAAFAVYPSSF
ncbi:MAG: hypothetical protein IKX56_08115 [Muribaculaceae bacterium]|nr:hypothetical protein [Muribaculaceae bacterium]